MERRRRKRGVTLALVVLFHQAVFVYSSDCDYYYDASLNQVYSYQNTFTTDCVGRSLELLPNDLDPYTRHLHFSSNYLTIIENSAFVKANLTGLITLDLSNNKIDAIEESAFKGLSELKILRLDNNYIASLSQNTFEDCAKLWYLGLKKNPLLLPDDEPFLNTQSLKTLDLSDCDLDDVPSTLLADGSKLQVLKLRKNNLRSLNCDVFKNLRRVELDSNNIRNLSSQIFHSNGQLVYLSLSNNALRIKRNEPIVYSKSLRYLYLNKCSITEIKALSFANITNLEELYINENFISKINTKTFSYLENLRVLSLRYNNITSLQSNTFKFNIALKRLDLTGNGLSEVEIPFLELSSLTHLDLSSCNINSLESDFFAGTVNLTRLSLAGNYLETVDVSVLQHLTSLKAVDLSNNPLKCNKTLNFVWQWCNKNNIDCSAHCSTPQGDWNMMRYLEYSEVIHLTVTKVSSSERSLSILAMRAFIPLGAMALLIFTVFLIRWILHLALVRTYYYSYHSDDNEDEEGDHGIQMKITQP